MIIFTTIASILAITGSVWLFDKISSVYICPICAGVSGTWLWMLISVASGQLPFTSYQLPTAVLMGGSVVGIAYQTVKYLPAGKPALLWKTLFIPVGFAAVLAVAWQEWILAAGALAVLIFLAVAFLAPMKSAAGADKKVEELENKMKKCC